MPRSQAMVCVVDDDASVRKSIRRLLLASDLPAEGFDGPTQFLAYAETHPVGLAILDIRMPGSMNGLELQNLLLEKHPDVPVIIITATPDSSARQTALANGASGFFHKPFDAAELVAAAKNAIGSPARAHLPIHPPTG